MQRRHAPQSLDRAPLLPILDSASLHRGYHVQEAVLFRTLLARPSSRVATSRTSRPSRSPER
jgi:hypothetical protein